MSIININKNTKHIAAIDTYPFLHDNNLSWKAKGILITLLCFPDKWIASLSTITECSKEKGTSLTIGIKELIENEYIEIIKVSDKKYNYILKEKNNKNQNIIEKHSLINETFIDYIKKNKKTIYPLLNVEEKKKKKKKYIKSFDTDSEEYKIAELFYKNVEKQNPLCDMPNLNEWATIFSTMPYTHITTLQEIKFVIEYTFNSDFWEPFMLNPYAFKAKFLTLKTQAYQKKKERKSAFDEAREDGYT